MQGGKVVHEYNVTMAIQGQSVDGPVVYSGKVVHEYNVTIAVQGQSVDGTPGAQWKSSPCMQCNYGRPGTIHGQSMDSPPGPHWKSSP